MWLEASNEWFGYHIFAKDIYMSARDGTEFIIIMLTTNKDLNKTLFPDINYSPLLTLLY